MERTIGVSPIVGGLLGSATCRARPNGNNGSRGNIVALGEKSPSLEGGGWSKRIPATDDTSWKGLVVMASARGDIIALSSGYAGPKAGLWSVCGSLDHIEERPKLSMDGFERRGKSIDWKPNPAGGPNPGVGGGWLVLSILREKLKTGGDGVEAGAGAGADEKMGAGGDPLDSNGPILGRLGSSSSAALGGAEVRRSRVFCSISSFHEKCGGADAGPGETWPPGEELPRGRVST